MVRECGVRREEGRVRREAGGDGDAVEAEAVLSPL